MIEPVEQAEVSARIIQGDCLRILKELPDNSIDSCVTDPPAAISFMGKKWDGDRGGRAQWVAWLSEAMAEVLRVVKPGGHALVWALPRTSHWTALALEDAGWEIRDRISHIHGQGFPKSHDISKAIDRMRNDDIRPVCRFLRTTIDASEHTTKSIAERFSFHPRMVEHWAARDTDSQPSVPKWEQWIQLKDLLGFCNEMDAEVWRLNGRKGKPGEAWYEREVVGQDGRTANTSWLGTQDGENSKWGIGEWDITAPATEEAKQWEGWGSALKPATEDWWLVRKPPSEKNLASNVLKWGTGGLNIDASRVGLNGEKNPTGSGKWSSGKYAQDEWTTDNDKRHGGPTPTAGRFPANLLLSHVPGPNGCVRVGSRRVKGTKADTSEGTSRGFNPRGEGVYGNSAGVEFGTGYADPDGMEEVADFSCVESCPVKALDEQSGQLAGRGSTLKKLERTGNEQVFGTFAHREPQKQENNGGGASRFFSQFHDPGFFYCAKSSKRDRTANGTVENVHPTCKPTELMRYLLRLVTPPAVTACERCYNNRYEKDSTETASKATSMRDMRNGVQAERQPPPASVLLESVSIREPEKDTASPVRGVRDGVQAGPDGQEGAEVLLEAVREQGNTQEQGQGLRDKPGGIQTSPHAGPSESEQAGLHYGAPDSDGGGAGSSADEERSGTSQERDKGRQSPGEPESDASSQAQLTTQAAAETNTVSTLPRVNSNLGTCSACGSALSRRGGVVLDPFAGSGTTGVSALSEGFNAILIEQDEEYCEIAERRCAHALNERVESPEVEVFEPEPVRERWEDERTGPEPDDLTYGEVIEKFATALSKTEEQFKDKLF